MHRGLEGRGRFCVLASCIIFSPSPRAFRGPPPKIPPCHVSGQSPEARRYMSLNLPRKPLILGLVLQAPRCHRSPPLGSTSTTICSAERATFFACSWTGIHSRQQLFLGSETSLELLSLGVELLEGSKIQALAWGIGFARLGRLHFGDYDFLSCVENLTSVVQ